MSRLPEPFGSRIDRNRPIRFSFEGRAFEGFEGDCIASALGASGQWLLSRSFKYHRPRGVVSMAGAEANTLVQLASEPNVAADLAPLCDGMKVTAQNVNGSLQSDRDALIGRFAKLLPVGFYYRTFTGPTRNAWLKVWEPMIRRKAGLGVIDAKAPHRHFDMAHLHCDLLVVGAGPAGLSAAIAAAGAGADVVLCDENPEIGGSLTYRRCEPDVLTRLASAAAALPSLRILPGTVCNGWYEDNWLPLIQGDRLYRTRARQVVVATGAIEQPALFRNNDLPGNHDWRSRTTADPALCGETRPARGRARRQCRWLSCRARPRRRRRCRRGARRSEARYAMTATWPTHCRAEASKSYRARLSPRHRAQRATNMSPASASTTGGSSAIWWPFRLAQCPRGSCRARPAPRLATTKSRRI